MAAPDARARDSDEKSFLEKLRYFCNRDEKQRKATEEEVIQFILRDVGPLQENKNINLSPFVLPPLASKKEREAFTAFEESVKKASG